MSDMLSFMDGLNPEQQQAVMTTEGPLLVLSGAGTGKTYTVISKILYSIESLNINPSDILALTFTNAAGKEMEARYKASSTQVASPYFGTFHSFCYKLLRENLAICKKLGYDDVPEVINDFQERTIHTKAQMLTNVGLRKAAYHITYQPTKAEKFEFDVFHKTVDKLLRENNKITFDRLCYWVCDLFTQNDPLIAEYLSKYKYVYVDEFQDTDKLQWKFVQSFLNHSTVIVVGDVRQCLYSFRGADSSIIKSLLKDDEWTTIKLEQNYRSTKIICDYANNFVKKYNDDVENIELVASREGPTLRHTTCKKFLDNIASIKNDDVHTTAIICRTNAEIKYITEALNFAKIPYRTKESKHFGALAVCSFDTDFRRSYLLNLLPEAEKAETLRKMYLDKNYDPLFELELRFNDLMDRINSFEEYPEYDIIRQLYELGELNLSDLSDSMLMQTSNDLYVGTIHSVKGLEFDSVYVYGVNSRSFDVMKNEDMMNLYYVACTRAKTLLTIITEN